MGAFRQTDAGETGHMIRTDLLTPCRPPQLLVILQYQSHKRRLTLFKSQDIHPVGRRNEKRTN